MTGKDRIIAIEKRNGHDLVQIKDHFDARLADLAKLMDERFKDQKSLSDERDAKNNIRFEAIIKSTDLAREVVDVKFLGTNEWRETVTDQQRNFPTKAEVQQQFDGVSQAIKDMSSRHSRVEQTVANLEGRLIAGGAGVAIVSIAVTIALHFIK